MVIEGSKALVIDPRRDVDLYLETAAREGARITHVFETHRNEDYVIGSMELMERSGAQVRHGPGLDWDYGTLIGDGGSVRLGSLELRALHTPGHTEESMSYVLYDHSAGEDAVAAFTGDTLFVGDVGRTDLPGPEKRERLSHALFSSIHGKLLPLGDGCMVLPGHGAGSVCGADISERPFSTIGLERAHNRMLSLSEGEFVRVKMEERLDRPPYFRRMEVLNLRRHPAMSGLPEPFPMSPREFHAAMDKGAVVLDTRMPHGVAGAYIEGALSVWLDGLAIYAGWLLPFDRPLLLITEDPSQVGRAVRILLRLGYDSVIGYLRGGMEGWCRAGMGFKRLATMSVQELKARLDSGEVHLVDPRPGHEREDEWVEGSQHLFVGEMRQRMAELPRDRPLACMCSGGFRGGMAAVMLQDAGFANVTNVLGGLAAWRAVGFPLRERGD